MKKIYLCELEEPASCWDKVETGELIICAMKTTEKTGCVYRKIQSIEFVSKSKE